MNFSASLGWMFDHLPFAARFDAAAKAGFKAVEFPHAFDQDPAEIRRTLQSLHLDLVTFNIAPGRWRSGERGFACHPGREKEFDDAITTALAFADIVRPRYLTFLAGQQPEAVTNCAAWITLQRNLRHAAARCAEDGFEVLVENVNRQDVPRFFLGQIEAAGAAVVECGARNVGLQFDAYHAYVAGENVPDALDRWWSLVKHVQIADAPGRHEPGTGVADICALMQTLRARNYGGYVTCEYFALRSEAESVAWLERTLSV